MNEFWSHWYFHIPNFILAAAVYTLLGRLALGFFVPENWDNFIWRGFRFITDPVVRVVRTITPAVLAQPVVLIFAVLWLMALRLGYFVMLFNAGLAPGATPGNWSMERTGLIPVMAIAIVNGIFSPWVLVLIVLRSVWYPSWAPQTSQFVYMASALVLSTLTLMVAGVPAAIYERLSARPQNVVVASIWLGCAALLTLPALPNIMRALSGG